MRMFVIGAVSSEMFRHMQNSEIIRKMTKSLMRFVNMFIQTFPWVESMMGWRRLDTVNVYGTSVCVCVCVHAGQW